MSSASVTPAENVPADIASRRFNSIDASIGVERYSWEAMLWARNLTNDNYLPGAFPSVLQNGSYSGYTNAPRSYGLTLRHRF